MSLPLVLITGATGFIGAHVLHQALEAGYPVRITVRPPKVDVVREQHGNRVEVVPITDVSTGDYSEALKGVGAIIHVAAPVPSKASPAELIDGAVNGSLNILRHAAAAGVHRVVVTSSWATVVDWDKPTQQFDSNHTYTEKSWNPATQEQALDGSRDPFWAYTAAKTVAEKGIWKFAAEHPEIDITTINPPYIYGPLAPGFKVNKNDQIALSTDRYFYRNVLGQPGTTLPALQMSPSPTNIDVRDVAKAHILALTAPPSSEVGQKRLLIAGPCFSWKDAVEHLAKARPELKDRLPDASEAVKTSVAATDTSRAREVLGLNYTDWEKTVEDTADSLLAVEKSWA